LLCGTCNQALGLLRDDPNLALAAAAYLRTPPAVADGVGQHRAAELGAVASAILTPDAPIDRPCAQQTRQQTHGQHTRHVGAYTRQCDGWNTPTVQNATADTTPVTGFHILHLTPTDSQMFKASCHCGRWSPTVLVTRQEARDAHDLHLLNVGEEVSS
jgi:hypothetical protein